MAFITIHMTIDKGHALILIRESSYSEMLYDIKEIERALSFKVRQ